MVERSARDTPDARVGPAMEAGQPWAPHHELWLGTGGASERAHPLAHAQGPAVTARPPKLHAPADPRRFARACVEACLAQILPNASALAAGSEQAEHVHQLRIGLRRLRTALGEMAEFDCGIDPGWETPLAGLFRALGRRRNHELLAELADELRAAGAPPLRIAPPPTAASTLAALRDGAVQQALLALLAFAKGTAPASGPAFDGDPVQALLERLDKLRRGLRRNAGHFTDLSAEKQHRVRKRLKRLRYLAEFIGPQFKTRRVGAYLDELRPAQDQLGAHNDEAMALAYFSAQAVNAGNCFAVGWLQARRTASEAAAAEALTRAVKAKPFWHGRG